MRDMAAGAGGRGGMLSLPEPEAIETWYGSSILLWVECYATLVSTLSACYATFVGEFMAYQQKQ